MKKFTPIKICLVEKDGYTYTSKDEWFKDLAYLNHYTILNISLKATFSKNAGHLNVRRNHL